MKKYILFQTKVLFENQILTEMCRRGMSHQSIPGVVFSSGSTWTEMRRTTLHTLKDFGYGKDMLEDIVEEEIENLLEYIDKHYLNQPISVVRSVELQD